MYDNGGRQTSSTYNNSVVETRAYNTDNTLTSISFGGSGTSIGDMTYAWDDNHNKTSETISGTMSNYGFSIPTGGYDGEDRLVSFNRTSGLTQSWSLSAVGDWSSVTTNSSTQTRTHGPTHELLTGGGSSVSTDVKGNITLIPSSLRPTASGLSSVWDFDNRLVSATTGSTTVTHQYDALGRRVSHTVGSTTTIFVQAGQQTIADYTAGAAPASSTYRYVYASYIDEPVMRWQTSNSTPVYYHRNQQYSVTALTDSSGSVLERYAYTAYGVPTIANASGSQISNSAISNRYLYTGREWDNDIQQYHYRARMYDPQLGRFCSRDPIGYLDSWNAWQYVQSKPLVSTDSSGLCTQNWTGPCTMQNFSQWYMTELAELNSWLPKLKPCPCQLKCFYWLDLCKFKLKVYETPCRDGAPSGFSQPLFHTCWYYHTGCKYELRESDCSNVCNPGNQCTYDANGNLLVTSPGAGSADRFSGACGNPSTEHVRGDVEPYTCAAELEAQGFNAFARYHRVRPVNGGLPCSQTEWEIEAPSFPLGD